MMPTERGSPANLDAEEALLACCILDESQEVVGQCVDAGLTTDAFFSPSHQYVWEAVKAVHLAGGGMDEILIVHQLDKAGRLELVGGHAELNRLVNRVESTTLARYWLEIVKEKALARKLISQATGIVEGIHQGQSPTEIAVKAEALADLGATAGPGPKRSSKRAQDKLCRMAEGHFFDPKKEPPETPLIFSLAGFPILHGGNFLSLLAGKSSGKSSTVGAMLASLYGDQDADYLNFSGFNPHQKFVLHTDTEQSEKDHDSMLRRSMRRGRMTEIPDCIRSVHLRRFAPKIRADMICALARKYHEERGLHVVFLDGYADLLRNINDEGETSDLLAKFMELIEDTGCGIAATLHVNPGSKRGQGGEKGRGHAGTGLENVSENVLLLTKQRTGQDEIISIEVKDGRHGLGPGASNFRWSDDTKMHITARLGEGFAKAETDHKREALRAVARDAIGEAKALPYLALCNGIQASRGVSKTTAERRIKEIVAAKVVDRDERGFYSICDESETL